MYLKHMLTHMGSIFVGVAEMSNVMFPYVQIIIASI